MPTASMKSSACVLVTGATGFLGKIVLQQLMELEHTVGLRKVFLIIRPKRGEGAAARFRLVSQADCFAGLSAGWAEDIEVLEGNLSVERCGLSDTHLRRLCGEVTHIVHCAASVDFDLPVAQACDANIVGSLNVLALAKKCKHLRRMVSVSTAYVTPHRAGPLEEVLAPLPRPAQSLYKDALTGGKKKEELLKETGHPNTYTLTKCIAEHLLLEQRGTVPLRIVRPSIISAAWRDPFVGWIDSTAALAGFVAAIGAGYLHVVVGDWATHLDVVPVDAVAQRVLHQTFAPASGDERNRITYAVAGVEKAYSIRKWVNTIESFFQRYPAGRSAKLNYLGPRNWQYTVRRAMHHKFPARLAETVYQLRGNQVMARQAKRLVQKLDMINEVFPYFTHKTFDFRPSNPLDDAFDIDHYVQDICEGVSRHLMHQRPDQVSMVGAKRSAHRSDLAWAMTRPKGNWAIRLSAAVLTKALRRMFDEVTFDQRSFERAAEVAGDSNVVIIPTHRSYMDFLVCSYLFFSRPQLGIKIPHIAAAQEFSNIFGLGWLFQQMHAFYIKRGLGKADPALTQQVHDLVKNRETLQFFIEGQRSRARQFLPPRRGLLRALQSTGRRFTIFPVSISYDRVPEELALLRELRGQEKDKMALPALLRWTDRMVRGRVRLGRLHVACGAALTLNPDDDVYGFSRAVMTELQRTTVATLFHLRYFIQSHPQAGLNTDWLKAQIERRGGVVLGSTAEPTNDTMLDPALEQTLRFVWSHLFVPEVCDRQPQNQALAHHASENCFMPVRLRAPTSRDPLLEALLTQLFAPLCRDYETVARSVARFAGGNEKVCETALLQQTAYQDFNTAQAALRALEEQHLIERLPDATLQVLGQAADMENFARACTWKQAARKLRVARRQAVQVL